MHVLVTGGGRGIGAAVCRLGGARGWSVGVNWRADRAAAEATAAAVAASGGRVALLQGDVAEPGVIARIFDGSEAAFGPLTGVVVNAGIVAVGSPLADMTPERIETVVRVNLIAAILTAREAARRLGPGGSIVFVSSAAARLGAPGEFVDYAAAKGGIDTLTIGLSKELGPRGIRVNAVRPGLIDTDIHASGGTPDRAARLGATTPLGRPGTAEEVAEGVVWLLSDAASYVTGSILDIAGGR